MGTLHWVKSYCLHTSYNAGEREAGCLDILSPTLKNHLSSLTSLASEAFNLRTATQGPCCRTIGHPYTIPLDTCCCRGLLDGLGYADMCVGGWGGLERGTTERDMDEWRFLGQDTESLWQRKRERQRSLGKNSSTSSLDTMKPVNKITYCFILQLLYIHKSFASETGDSTCC